MVKEAVEGGKKRRDDRIDTLIPLLKPFVWRYSEFYIYLSVLAWAISQNQGT